MRTANPALNDNVFTVEGTYGNVMTLQGTVMKTGILLVLVVAGAAFAWTQVANNPQSAPTFIIAGLVVGLILAMVTIFKKTAAPYTSPVYALAEGVFLGALSLIFETHYPGIVPQAVGITFGTLVALLAAYSSGLIRATENFKLGVVAATGGICLVYLVSIVLNMFGSGIPYIHGSGWIGIGFSLFVVVIASLNLVLDFDFIENGVERGAPKYMEWYAAFGLLVTLVWLYIEILRLLSKLRGRN
ncbi:MAG: Bax inhibitor-1/YccA family protein [Planctomycetes bacterium]|nr:Bax inhibitor-1/YccA family protein [Planctomycetota bacterium]